MTNIRAKGFKNRMEFDQHISELDEDVGLDTDVANELEDIEAARKEIAWLRKEVADLREGLAIIRGEAEDAALRDDPHPWLRIASTVAVTFVLGRLVQRLRLGASGAVAVPMITAQLHRRIW